MIRDGARRVSCKPGFVGWLPALLASTTFVGRLANRSNSESFVLQPGETRHRDIARAAIDGEGVTAAFELLQFRDGVECL